MPHDSTNSPLIPCAGPWYDPRRVSTEIKLGTPRVVHVRSAIITPFYKGGRWGVFDLDGNPIEEAINYQGSPNRYLDQIPQLACHPQSVIDTDKSGLIFGGRINLYYGHFIFESLSRLWYIAQKGLNGRKVLFQTQTPLEHWFGHEFVQSFLAAIGIERSDIVECLNETEVFHDIIVPTPCMQMLGWIYPETTQKFFREIGNKLLKDVPTTNNNKIVYLSKSKISNKITGIVNEVEIEECLENLGVEIIYPETLSLSEQLAIFRDRKRILGGIGSVFHASGFSGGTSRQIVLAHSERINPNYTLMDMAFKTNIKYYHSPLVDYIGSKDGTGYALHCKNPKYIAQSLFDKINNDGDAGDTRVTAKKKNARVWLFGKSNSDIVVDRAYTIINRRDVLIGEALREDSLEGDRIDLVLIAHLQNIGDVCSYSGVINLGNGIEGVAISCGENILEHRVCYHDSTWSPWYQSGEFAGTRHQSKVIKGFTLRLKPEVAHKYRLRSFGRFVGVAEPIHAENAQDCVSESQSALNGIQISITTA
ncbi:glycosyltransferase family 61 protein [Labrys okinawensis]|uniref:glycosyltransferase family 61 protein n=1 Tax=Labrys okinawensis TaxID=346911 RepID=UPI0039BD0969